MRKFYLILLLLLSPPVVQLVMAQQEFVPFLGDVPLSHHVQPHWDSGFSFETTDGRIAEIGGVLVGGKREEVMEFYRQALVALGWQEGKSRGSGEGEGLLLRFIRDKEELQIDLRQEGRVTFYLNPL